jgi:hypothetical protein
MLSTAAGEAQGCKSLASRGCGFRCWLRAVMSASRTVRIMNTTEAPKTQRGAFRSIIQPNRSVLTMPPILAGGDDAKSSARSSRGRGVTDQHIARRRDHSAEKSSRAHHSRQQQRRQVDGGDGKYDHSLDRETGGRELAMALGPVGQKAAGQHADGAEAEICRQRDVG